ncbi:MAG: flagellar basal body rod protein FlgC [Legionellaceae bacterium]|nr:flagellar basal body rod protein FlgC [Legionellaceae bacterium]
MGLNNIFNIAGTAMTAETLRLTTTSSNMGNANVVTGDPNAVYRAKYPVFKAIAENAQQQWAMDNTKAGVKISGVYESDAEPIKRHEPNHPMADENGYVYAPNVNYVDELANMISASRSYQMDLDVIGVAKKLIQQTLHLGE